MLDIAYEDNPDEFKVRPVIIVGNEGEILLLVATTSQSLNDPPKFYDRFKIPIHNWPEAGLHRPSWVLGYRLISLTLDEFKETLLQTAYIGKLDESDFEYIIFQLENIHQN